jgi:hypothetical protein
VWAGTVPAVVAFAARLTSSTRWRATLEIAGHGRSNESPVMLALPGVSRCAFGGKCKPHFDHPINIGYVGFTSGVPA